MIGRILSLSLSLSLLLGEATANAGPTTIGSDFFRMAVPPGWDAARTDTQTTLHSPDGSIATVTSAAIDGAGDDERLRDLRRRLYESFRRTLESTANHPAIATTERFTEKRQEDGDRLLQQHGITQDGTIRVHQYALIGPRAGVLVVLETDPENRTARPTMEQSIRHITWRDPYGK